MTNIYKFFALSAKITAIAVFAIGAYAAIPNSGSTNALATMQGVFAEADTFSDVCGNIPVPVNTCAAVTANRTPAGTASASTIYSRYSNSSSQNAAQNAFNGSAVTGWAGNGTGDVRNGNGHEKNLPAWLMYDFGAGNERIVSEYTLYRCGAQKGGWAVDAYSPRNWEFQASNDAVNWITLDNKSGETVSVTSPKSVFYVNNDTPYRYHRIYIDGVVGPHWISQYYTNITEMEIVGERPAVHTYSWNTGGWGSCTNGTQTRPVSCHNEDGANVSESNCTATKPATTQSCYVPVVDPTCDITVSEHDISAGDTVHVTWNSTNANGLYINNGVGYAWVNHEGSRDFTLNSNTEFTCTATNATGETATDSEVVHVSAVHTYSWNTGGWGSCTNGTQTRPVSCHNEDGANVSESNCTATKPATTQSCQVAALPACGITASRHDVNRGETVRVNWNSTNANGLYINNGVGYAWVNHEGSRDFTIRENTTFTCTATDARGHTMQNHVTVRVHGAYNTHPHCVITASRGTINSGEEVEVTWNSQDATSVYINQSIGYTTPNNRSSHIVRLYADTTFVCTATDDDGETTRDSVTVRVHHVDPAPYCSTGDVTRPGHTTIDWTNSTVYISGIGYLRDEVFGHNAVQALINLLNNAIVMFR